MDIILHVGAHRTATTTLQRMMGQSREALSQAGVAYWGPKRTRGGLFQGLIGQGDAVMPWQARRAQTRIAHHVGRTAEKGYRTLFVSEENMIGSMRAALDDQCLFAGAGARVERFARGMEGHSLTIAICLRSYEAWWASVIAFRLTRGGPMPRPGLCRKLVAQPRRWRHVVSELSRALPEARIAVWTHERMSPYPNRMVARLTGRALNLRGAREQLNPAQSPEALRNYVADIGLNPDLIRCDAHGFMPFTPDQRAELRAHYAEDLAWLSAGAGGLATLLDEPGHKIAGLTGLGRGRPDDADHRRLARAR